MQATVYCLSEIGTRRRLFTALLSSWLALLAGCAAQTPSKSVKESPSGTDEVPADVRQYFEIKHLQDEVKRLSREVQELRFDEFVEENVEPTESKLHCQTVVSQWPETQKTIKQYLDNSTINGQPDPYMVSRLNFHLFFLNKTCNSNLVWNP
jgi:hypothetical protein